jgi:hypothetical protein
MRTIEGLTPLPHFSWVCHNSIPINVWNAAIKYNCIHAVILKTTQTGRRLLCAGVETEGSLWTAAHLRFVALTRSLRCKH